MGKHIADAESIWRVCNISPDMCVVGGQVVPFDICRELAPEKANYSSNVHARGAKVLHVNSINQGVIGNAGSGVVSGVSQGAGNTIIKQGSKSVRVNGEPCARHLDLCWMNVS
jgi:Domain of unknown function (DUF4150)